MTNLLRSRLLAASGARHGFNLRSGGTSTDAGYASANLGRSVGDDPDAVETNHQLFARAVGYAPGTLYDVDQVHGRSVRLVGVGDDPADVRRDQADAVVATTPGVAIGVKVADCVPLLLFDRGTRRAAAIHAGWRGVVAGVVEAGVGALLALPEVRGDGLCAAIFPHIGRCCFEVGEDVAAALLAVSPDPDVVDRARLKPHVDLAALITAKLARLGVERERIDAVQGCTRCEPERFFSYRRDGRRSGRHVAAIVSG